ncbi:MAG: hypothetical protein U1C70_12735 [Sediminibacterium sp.]|jgi:hypothetical protein|uniref:hypothetical protein n=1 Tax=Sediminibacterium sp. TaxID=1917865 RepID=UPI002ABCAAAE|nr:hypothetical protein [Sediminibacterium sp.]MDZ4072686.1 hypothetical protein [Sediminibacterium sp.]
MHKIVSITIALFLFSNLLTAQDQNKRDSIVNLICKTIVENRTDDDTTRVNIAFEKYLYNFLATYNETEREEVFTNIYYRLQRNCLEFKKILQKLIPNQGDWEILTEKPTSKVTAQDCREFKQKRYYYYLEANGSKTRVEIHEGFWTDTFTDSTYSKLKFKWINDCEFEIEFIESNNESRKNMSKKGDTYRYSIIDRKENYYDMVLEVVGAGQLSRFKMYY